MSFCAVRLRQASVAVKFVTNTTKESKRILLERLQHLNFDLQVKCPTLCFIKRWCFSSSFKETETEINRRKLVHLFSAIGAVCPEL